MLSQQSFTMNEPLVCWLTLTVLALWGIFSSQVHVQRCLTKYLKCFVRPLQWYNLSFTFLTLFFARTFYDIFRFDYVRYHFLDQAKYQGNCAGVPQAEWDAHVVGLPSFLRWISLASPIAGFLTFLIVAWQVVKYLRFSWKLEGDEYAEWVSHPKVFMPFLVISMPMVFVVMALRATVRQWATMTCSGWFAFHLADPTMSWNQVKALELSTYTQDLAVANAFQFLAVWAFGQACAQALKKITATDSEDKFALMQAGVLGVHAFVLIGMLRSVVTMLIAAAQTNMAWNESVTQIQTVFAAKVDPMFLFATVLCVVNMLILGRMNEVQKVLGNVNAKFNATRALLLIGQGQMLVLTAATTSNSSYDKIMSFLHKVPGLENLAWEFNIEQARLFHSSLLCFECVIIAYVNSRLWDPEAASKMLSEPLLEADGA